MLGIWTGKYRDNRWRGTLLPTPGKVLIGLRKLVREGIDGYLGSGKARCKLASLSLRLCSALAQRSIKTNSPSLSAIARGEGRGEGSGGLARGEGGRKEKNRGRERKKNDLANFSYRVQGQWDNQCEAEAPPHLSPIHSPFKGIKGIRVQPLSL